MSTLFGIKNCDTVRKAKQWLDSNAIDYTFHDFRVDGIKATTLQLWLSHVTISQLVNKRSTSWKALSESERQTFSDLIDQSDAKNEVSSKLIKQLLKTPTLIKRPVLTTETGSVIVGFSDKLYQSKLI